MSDPTHPACSCGAQAEFIFRGTTNDQGGVVCSEHFLGSLEGDVMFQVWSAGDKGRQFHWYIFGRRPEAIASEREAATVGHLFTSCFFSQGQTSGARELARDLAERCVKFLASNH